MKRSHSSELERWLKLSNPLIEQKPQPAEKITVYDVSNSAMKKISEQYDGKINTSESIPHACQDADLIILAVKPQNVCKVYEEMRKADISKNSTLLSVIAGKPISSFTNGTGMAKIARSMPNTPPIIGQGLDSMVFYTKY